MTFVRANVCQSRTTGLHQQTTDIEVRLRELRVMALNATALSSDISRRNPQDEYELIQRIGSGTYGDVYKVKQTTKQQQTTPKPHRKNSIFIFSTFSSRQNDSRPVIWLLSKSSNWNQVDCLVLFSFFPLFCSS